MTFDPKDKANKAQLYRALVAAAELANERFDDFLQRPFNPPWALAANYRRNLQRGDYSAIRAKVLYDFLMQHHFPAAHSTAPDIFPETPEMRWQSILEERAITGQLAIVPMRSTMGIVQRASAIKNAATKIKRGQLFCFELTSNDAGHVLALQGVNGLWHAIPLGHDGQHTTPIKPGTTILPQTPDGKPDPMVEHNDLGLHTFVLVTAPTTAIPPTLDRLITWVNQHSCALHEIDVNLV